MLNNQKPSMPVLIQDLGQRFPTKISKQKRRYGIYKCHCGFEFIAQTTQVKSGKTKSCGCYKIALLTSHGLHKHPLYKVWSAIIDRTTNKNNKYFEYYGGRGITICGRWRNSFKGFYDWCIANGWRNGLDIDRIDNDKGYATDNCRFVSHSVNCRNTRLIHSTNTSGYRGVILEKRNNKWVAYLTVNKKRKHIGYFATAIEAAKAYNDYVLSNGLEHPLNIIND